MIKIGITGGIGSGKSVVSRIIASLGFGVYDSDRNANRLMTDSEDVRKSIVDAVGKDAYMSDGTLNKQAVASFLYAGEENRKIINSIVHPAVFSDFESWCAQQNSEMVFVESAILFESGFDAMVDKTVMVYAPEDVRLKRVMSRDRITVEQTQKRISSQMPDEEKSVKCDFVIHNGFNERLVPQIFSLLKSIRKTDF